MPTYAQLHQLRLGPLEAAVESWRNLAQDLGEVVEEARSGMLAKARGAQWAGANADVAKPFIVATGQRFALAQSQAIAIFTVIRDLCEYQRVHRRKLRQLEEEAREQGLNIDADGRVSVRPNSGVFSQEYMDQPMSPYAPGVDPYGVLSPPDTEVTAQAQGAIDTLVARIELILSESAETDQVAARALYEIVGDDPDSFSASPYYGLSEAETSQGIVDGREAVTLIKLGPDLSDAELSSLNRYLTNHQDNEDFAVHLATHLSPEELLTFTSDLADVRNHSGTVDETRLALVTTFGEGLGATLGTATRSDDPAMHQWQQDVIDLGAQRLISPHQAGPYASQIMSDLMRHGEYGGDFLHDYGNALVAADISRRDDGLLWSLPDHPEYESILGDDYSQDPVTGFMQGLSHVPEAATRFFSDDDTLEYFFAERPFLSSPDEFTASGENLALEATGNALLAATSGMNPDDPTATFVEHQQEHRDIFDRVLESGNNLGDDLPPEFRQPLANVFINHGDAVHETAIDIRNMAPLDEQHLFEVAKQVSRDPDAYGTLNEGMHYHLLESLHSAETYYGEELEPSATLSRAGRAVGWLEQARYQALDDQAGNDSQAASWNARWGYHLAGSALNFVPFAGDLLQRFGADAPAAAWLQDEQSRIEDNLTTENQETSTVRERQLVELAEEWHSRNMRFSADAPGYDGTDGMYDRINESADHGRESGKRTSGK